MNNTDSRTANIPTAPTGYMVEVNGWNLEVYKADGQYLGGTQYVLVGTIQRDDTDAEVKLEGERFYNYQFASPQAAMDFIVARTSR